MNLANFKISICNSVEILKKFDLFKDENYRRGRIYDSSKFSNEFIRISNSSNYVKIYDTLMKYGDYDIILTDDSVFQFSLESTQKKITKYRFAFYQNPKNYPTYEQFLEEELGETYENCGSIFWEEYEQVMCEATLNDGAIPIRYDYDERLYDEKFHPVSHIHIGHNNSIRIACDKILTPDTFTLFVIRNVYYRRWKELCENQDGLLELSCEQKRKCGKIADDFLSERELQSLYIS